MFRVEEFRRSESKSLTCVETLLTCIVTVAVISAEYIATAPDTARYDRRARLLRTSPPATVSASVSVSATSGAAVFNAVNEGDAVDDIYV